MSETGKKRRMSLPKILRGIRILLASLTFALALFLFADVSGTAPRFFSWIARIQFFPAVLALNVLTAAAILIAAFLLGRIYCSILCPLGVFQDLIWRISGKGQRRPTENSGYEPPRTKLKWGIFGAFILLTFLGFTSIAAFAEPYSIFGRIASQIFSPAWRLGSNALAALAAAMDSYAVGTSELAFKGLGAFLSSLLLLAAVSALAWKRGRLWCNAVCPVGTLLGAISRFSIVRPRIDLSKCVQCRLCERSCRAHCIDVSGGTVDASRCVVCLDCTALCRPGAIRMAAGSPFSSAGAPNAPKEISRSGGGREEDPVPAPGNADQSKRPSAPVPRAEKPDQKSEAGGVDSTDKTENCRGEAQREKSAGDDAPSLSPEQKSADSAAFSVGTGASEASGGASSGDKSTPLQKSSGKSPEDEEDAIHPQDPVRRAVIAFAGMALGTAVLDSAAAHAKTADGGLAPLKERLPPVRDVPLAPPGAISLENLRKYCTGCQLCITQCPNNVLRPSSAPGRWMQPEMTYENGRCRPECTRCSNICPTGAIRPISRPEKASLQIGHAVWSRDKCLASSQGISCGNCARHCPVGAILMVPGDENDPKSVRIPLIDTERCIGCGACEHLCPVRPISAIVVHGHEIHRIV